MSRQIGIFYTAVTYVPSPTLELDCPLVEHPTPAVEPAAEPAAEPVHMAVSKAVSMGRTIYSLS